MEMKSQSLGQLARLSNVSTTEQIKEFVEGYVGDNFVHLSGDTNIGTLQLSGELKTAKLEANNAVFGYNNHSELCSVAEGSTNHAISPFSHAEGDGNSYAGSKSFTIKVVSTDKLSITLKDNDDISQIQLSDELIIQNSGASDLRKIVAIDAESKTIQLDSKVGTSTKANSYVMVMHKPWLGNVVRGDGAHVEGYQNMAFEDAHAENIMNAAYGKYSHCHGNANKAGWMATAFGTGNSALGNGSIALGGASATNGQYTVCDTNAIVKGANSFAWSGNGKYEVTKGGTFNINPVGGAKGFYIGSQSLPDIIHEIAEGRIINDSNSKTVKLDINGETLVATVQPEQIIDENIDKFKAVYNDTKDEYENVAKTIDEINAEVEHLYVITTEEDDEYNYYQIVITKENGTTAYSWKKVTEKAKVSYIKKEGDTDIGPLSLNDTLAVGRKHVVGSKCAIIEGFSNKSGSMGYNMLSGNFNTLTIEIDIPDDEEIGFDVGDVLSFKFGQQTNISSKDTSTILSINGHIITVDKFPGTISDRNLYDDDGNMLFGLGTRLVFCYKHNVGNVSMGICNHVEGSFNQTVGNANWAHIEGFKNKVIDNYGHAEGMATVANHSSHAEGRHTEATGQGSHSEGMFTVADGSLSHAAGRYATTSSKKGHIERLTIDLHAGDYVAFVEDSGFNKKLVKVDPAEVYDPTAGGKTAPFDLPCVPTGYKYANKGTTTASSLSGDMIYDPRKRDSLVHHSKFVGKTIQCDDSYDYDIDWVVKITNDGTIEYDVLSSNPTAYTQSYVWNGYDSAAYRKDFYESHGNGTFNINPTNGVKGFYIGEDTLSSIIDNAIKAHDAQLLKSISFDPSLANGVDYLANTLQSVIAALGGTITQ